MPVAPEVRGLDWNDDDMAGSRADGVSAAGAAVGLEGAIRVHHPDVHFDAQLRVDRPVGDHRRAQSTRAKVTAKVATTST